MLGLCPSPVHPPPLAGARPRRRVRARPRALSPTEPPSPSRTPPCARPGSSSAAPRSATEAPTEASTRSTDCFDESAGWRDDAATRGRFGGEHVLAAAPHAATVAVRAQAVGPHRVVRGHTNDGEKEEPDGIRTRRRPTRRADVDASAPAALAEYLPANRRLEAKAAGGGASRGASRALLPELFRSAWHAAKDRLATPLRRDACEFSSRPARAAEPPGGTQGARVRGSSGREDPRRRVDVPRASSRRGLERRVAPAAERALGAEEAAAAAAAAAADDAGGPSSSGGPPPLRRSILRRRRRLIQAALPRARRGGAVAPRRSNRRRGSRRPPPPGSSPGSPRPRGPPGGCSRGSRDASPGSRAGTTTRTPGFAGARGFRGFGGLGRAIMPGFPAGEESRGRSEAPSAEASRRVALPSSRGCPGAADARGRRSDPGPPRPGGRGRGSAEFGWDAGHEPFGDATRRTFVNATRRF